MSMQKEAVFEFSLGIFLGLIIIGLGYLFFITTPQQVSRVAQLIAPLTHPPQPTPSPRPKHYSETVKLPILLYHYVEVVTDLRDTIRQSLDIRPSVLETQITTVIDAGYTPIVLDDLTDYYEGRKDLPERPIIFSFDDGYRDFYTDVFPILKKYHIKAVSFQPSGFLDKNRNYMTTSQLLEIAGSGLVEIDAHTVNHANLTAISLTSARTEITQGKHALEALLGHPVHHFAYPYGRHDAEVEKLVAEAGFQTGLTTDKGEEQSYTNRFHMTRIRPGSNTGQALLSIIGYTR
jgi:peptidoglycan/xylan/chitin deacetylase (PgdA/CDA1 family)